MATTGYFTIGPNTVNSVPRDASLEIDVRDIEGARRDGVVNEILAAAAEIAKRRDVELTTEMINQDPPATCSDEVRLVLSGENLRPMTLAGSCYLRADRKTVYQNPCFTPVEYLNQNMHICN